MLLNAIEKALMNNPVRAAVQRRFEAQRLLAMGGPVPGAKALEVGCGRGVGTELVLDVFGAQHVDAFDLDPDMVQQASKRLEGRPVCVRVGDVEHIDAEDGTYDAVFDFAIIHHVPDWRAALREIHRVLRPGGRFYAEEVLDRFIVHPVWRRVLEHPLEDRFDRGTFVRGLEEAGFEVVASKDLFGQFAWFVADARGSRVTR
jgi:ubiquinone/menaquinone biosynthesis C-methylase UbiE